MAYKPQTLSVPNGGTGAKTLTGVCIGNGTSAITATATPSVTSITIGGGTALANYVEGSWTPALQGSGGNPSPTYGIQVGRYTRIGNRVTVSFTISTTAISGGSGDVRIANLPFTSANITNLSHIGACLTTNITLTSANDVSLLVSTNTAYIQIAKSITGSSLAKVQISDWAATGLVIGTVSYQV